MKNIRIITASALTLFASASMASPLHGQTSGSAGFSISIEEVSELLTYDTNNTLIAADRFSLPVEKPFYSATVSDEDGAQGTGVAPIPVPTAVWLFGSGLIGLVVVARRRS